MLKRTPSLTEQAKSHIKQSILDDAFEDGKIPSETELATDLGVSRTTIRDALSRLENEGVVYRKQGAGTGIPVTQMLETEAEKLLQMEDRLHERIVGQNQAINALADAIRIDNYHMIVLSHYQTQPLLAAKDSGAETAVISLDLNITTTEIGLSQEAVILPDRQSLTILSPTVKPTTLPTCATCQTRGCVQQQS